MIKRFQKVIDTTDPAILKHDLLIDLNNDLINAIRNGNSTKIEQIKRRIKEVEAWHVES